MSIKYDYESGFCRVLHYNGLWPVKYEGTSGHYRKIGMVCTCGDGKCQNDCEVFRNIPDVKSPNMEWLMRDELYTANK